MTDALSIATGGLLLAGQKLQASANNIATAPVTGKDITSDIVDIIQTKSLFKANIAVIKTEDEMTQSLLDVIA